MFLGAAFALAGSAFAADTELGHRRREVEQVVAASRQEKRARAARFFFVKSAPAHGEAQRMIPMSVQEIKQFWHGFCERQKIKPEVRAEGDKRIEQDPEFWADQTMWQLVEAIDGKSPQRRDQ